MRLRPAATGSTPVSTGPFKQLSGKSTRPPPNQPISFKGKVLTKNNNIAQKFCKQFTSTVSHKSDPKARKVKRVLRANHKIDTSYTLITSADTRKAIDASKCSSAVGPDGITAVHLKHIGHGGLTI
jgi:hypothetical protein